MKTVIHVNMHKIRSNSKGTELPVLTIKTYKERREGNRVIIYGQDGLVAAEVIYSPSKPLNCGAKCWIETTNKVDVK